MNQQFLALLRAELYKLFTRPLVKGAILLSIALGLAVPWFASGFLENAVVQGKSGSELAPTDAAAWAVWAMYVRNFYVLRLFIVLSGAALLAGELAERTLREELLRPVSRLSLILVKWLALSAFSALTVALTGLAGGVVGLALGGGTGDIGAAALCALGTWATDSGFAALVLAISAMSSSVVGTVAGMVLFVLADTAAWAFLGLVSWATQLAASNGGTVDLPAWVDVALIVGPWLPSSAFNAWTQYQGDPIWQNWASLLVITLLSLVTAHRVFERRDVL
jgi:ABC-type transport system involved in multi-copper enzyme maturation permease subunit